MAFSRNHALVMATPDDPAYENNPSDWNAALVVSGATVGGVPYFPTATTETTGAGLTFNASAVAGEGLAIAAGTATTDVKALSITQTWNNAAINFGGFKFTVTDTASGGGSIAFQILGGAAGTTNLFSVNKAGGVAIGSSFSATALTSTSYVWCNTNSERGLILGTSTDTNLSRISAGLFGVGTGTAQSFAGSLKAATYIGMMGTGAGIGNMVSTATVNTTAVATTGAGPDILMTYDLPLNSLSAATKGIHITAWGTSANTAEAKTITLEFGSTAILTNALTTSIAGVWRIEADVFSTGTDAQQYVSQLVTTGTAGVALNDVEQGTSAQDDGAAITIRCRGTIGAPSSAAGLVQEGLIVRFHN